MTGEKRIIILVGTSGSGKTTVGKRLDRYGIKKLVTTTTRPTRSGEVNGQDYYFIHEEELADYNFIESTLYNGFHYGLTFEELENNLKNYDWVHLAMDKSGAAAVKKIYPKETLVIFLTVSEEEMVRRMTIRGDDSEAIQSRLRYRQVENEAARPAECDLSIENVNLDKTVDQILNFIQASFH